MKIFRQLLAKVFSRLLKLMAIVVDSLIITYRQLSGWLFPKLTSTYHLFKKYFVIASKYAGRFGVLASIFIHRQIAIKPHEYLMRRSARYQSWHLNPRSFKVHHIALAAYSLVIGLIIFGAFQKVNALSDLTDIWNFGTPSNYTLTSGVETSGTSARLKQYSLASDSNTSALYNFNETSGSTAADSSGNNNVLTSATVSPWTVNGKVNGGLSLNGSTSLSAPDSASLSLNNSHSIEAWVKLGSTFNTSSSSDQYLLDKGSYKLYFDHNNGKLTYELAASSNSWLTQAGSNLNSSWNQNHDGVTSVASQVVVGSDVYYGLESSYGGSFFGGATVWKYNNSTNTTSLIGGNGLHGSFDGLQGYIEAMAINGTTLYVGTGGGASSTVSTVYSCDTSTGCATWNYIGTFSTGASNQGVKKLFYQNGHLYAAVMGAIEGLYIYSGSGSTWTLIGGTGSSPSSWTSSSFSGFSDISGDGANTIFTTLYGGNSNPVVWKCVMSGTACGSWIQIGGTGTANNWTVGSYNDGRLNYFGGNLYAMVAGGGAGVEVWRYSGAGTTWTKLGYSGSHPWVSLNSTSLALGNDGTNLYASVSDVTGAHLWKCVNPTSSCTWSDISNASGLTAYGAARVISSSGAALYVSGNAGTGAYYGDAYGAKYSSGSWSEIANPNTDWWQNHNTTVQAMAVNNSKVYSGLSGDIPSVWERNGNTWSEVGGNGINGSWKLTDGTYANVASMTSYGNNLFVALAGPNAGDGEVWMYSGGTWTKVGGDGVNSSWNTNYEGVYSLAVYNGNLYAGLGKSAGDGEVWMFDGTSWSQKGGDSVVGGTWATADGITNVDSLTVFNGELYAGLGSIGGNGKVYKYNGTTWSQVGGTASGNWGTLAYDVASMVVYNGKLYAGIQPTGSLNAAVYVYNSGTSWTQVGGSGINSSWGSNYVGVASLAVYNGNLYAGTNNGVSLANSTTAGVWSYNGSNWSNVSNSFLINNYVTDIASMLSYGGQLLTGAGGAYDQPGVDTDTFFYDPFVTSYGSNSILQSSSTSWNTNWHKVAASYDGTTMKLYVDGSLDTSLVATTTVPDNTLALVVGNSYSAPSASNISGGFLNGTVDELRISNAARSSFPNYDYVNTAQTVTLNNPVRLNGVWHWDNWADNETANGGTVTYRLSIDGGTTWLYWNGSNWTVSSSTSQSNDVATAGANINSLGVNFSGITWQAVLLGNGYQQVTLNSATLSSTSDIVAPTTNATNIQAKKAVGDSTFNLASNGWTNGGSPAFSWTAGSDASSGILGYCLYVGQDNTANPVTTKGMLGNSPTPTGNNCQFLVTSNSVDLGTAGYLSTAFTTSNSPYYLLIKAIDKAGNAIGTTSEFHFRFDNTSPINPVYITSPSGFINTKDVTLTWPTSGANAASDANSGVAGLQYRINGSSWYGVNHSGAGDLNDLLANNGTYTTIASPDYNNLVEGLNTVYFRTWDAAGNVTTSTVNAFIKLNTTGAPSEPQNLVATPPVGVTNSFAFSWATPVTFIGNASNISYCYTVNTLPTVNNCSYTASGVTSLSAGAYATQPGSNTFYVVARDEASNINYANYSSVTFTANTPAPGIPLNVDNADVSIKSTHNWRLAITWDTPASVGTGVALYKVYRSTDNATFSVIGSSSSTSYIDAGLSQLTYYYKVMACDSANNCSAFSATTHGYPTGKFTSPAVMIAKPTVNDITTRRATVTWTTDRTSDSKVSIGTTSGHYDPPETLIADQVTNHSVQLNNLSAGTTYYIMAKWTDEDGNTGQSQELSFTTAAAPVVKEVIVSSVGLTNATITFTSIGAYKVSMNYGQSDNFGGFKSVNTSASSSTYSLNLSGLNDGTKYFFQPTAYDSEGNAYAGNVFSFTTPPRPHITNLQFQPVAGEPTSTQQVSWKTNVPTDSTITYGVIGSTGTDITMPQMTTDHTIVINGLLDNSQYFLVAQSRDINGNLAVSDKQSFHTALDTRPPKISNVSIETSIRGTGSQARGQIIVSWKTDELATSQVAYGTGTSTVVLNNKTAEDAAYSIEHIVVISDMPTSEVYTIQPLSKDRSANQAVGNSQTAIIGRGSDDVLTIVLNTLQKVFGF